MKLFTPKSEEASENVMLLIKEGGFRQVTLEKKQQEFFNKKNITGDAFFKAMLETDLRKSYLLNSYDKEISITDFKNVKGEDEIFKGHLSFKTGKSAYTLIFSYSFNKLNYRINEAEINFPNGITMRVKEDKKEELPLPMGNLKGYLQDMKKKEFKSLEELAVFINTYSKDLVFKEDFTIKDKSQISPIFLQKIVQKKLEEEKIMQSNWNLTVKLKSQGRRNTGEYIMIASPKKRVHFQLYGEIKVTSSGIKISNLMVY